VTKLLHQNKQTFKQFHDLRENDEEKPKPMTTNNSLIFLHSAKTGIRKTWQKEIEPWRVYGQERMRSDMLTNSSKLFQNRMYIQIISYRKKKILLANTH